MRLEEEDDGPFVESCGERYHIMTLKDFIKFREFATSTEGWTDCYTSPTITVQTKPPANDTEKVNTVRVRCEFEKVTADVLYDSLHDPEYRKSWDANMLAGYNIVNLDIHNDIGYYAAKFPWPLQNRDFCNMRSWMEFTNGEYLIFNHSVPHNECPEKKDFIRAKSIITGYYMIPNPSTGGVTMLYVTQTDIRGSIPKSVLNYAMTKAGPSTMKKLEDCAEKYMAWSKEHNPDGWVPPWRTSKVAWDGSTEPSAKSTAALAAVVAAAADAAADEGSPTTRDKRSIAELTHVQEGDSLALHLAAQVEDLKRKLFIATQRGEGVTLAPVAPARPDDSPAIQQYRALMSDAVGFVDRLYLQEGRIPTLREYLTRLHGVLDSIHRTLPQR